MNYKTKSDKFTAGLLVSPAVFWLSLFFVIPLGIMLVYSFCEHNYDPASKTGISWIFTFKNYLGALDRVYLQAIWRSIWVSVVSTLICLILGYPIAYYISQKSLKVRNILLILVIIPFWTNFVVRTYAWLMILRENGLINSILTSLHFTDKPLEMLFTNGAVITGLVYGYLPFMILPLYASIEKINLSLIEAAYDLGANRFQMFFKVMFPLTLPGIIAGSILVFVPCLGAYVTPDLLGGAKVMMIGNLIQNQYTKVWNWPFGSAISFILLNAVLALLFLYIKFGDEEKETQSRNRN